MSIMVGVGRGAQAGVLVRNAEALERLEKVTTIVVDKTGTLTEGRPAVQEVVPAEAMDADTLLRLAASVEQASEHPLAAAVVRAAKERQLALAEVQEFQSTTGGGVSARCEGRRVMIGKPAYLKSQGVIDLDSWEQRAAAWQSEGKTAIFIAVDGSAAGLVSIADPIKATTPEAIEALHALGLRIVMLTGDNYRTAQSVAQQLHLDYVEAEVEPQKKAECVQSLKAEGQIVAMAGDGINDAPALAAADTGIAMGTGTDVAMQSAGITLVKGDLRGIARAIRLSRATMSNIRQNLVFAFLYNVVGIPVAAGLLYPLFGILLSPMLAGAAMSLSSVSVVGNALRLSRMKL
jgi:Cu+-exporting ATPase